MVSARRFGLFASRGVNNNSAGLRREQPSAIAILKIETRSHFK
jgi:hypothetical protein